MMKNKIILSVLFLFFICFCIPALKAQNIYFNFKDGTNTSYALSDVRSITFTGSIMNLNKWDGTTASWNVNTIGNYNYSGFTTGLQEAELNDLSIYPNPGSGPITIEYRISGADEIRIEFTDINGRPVKSLVQQHTSSGNYSIAWDGSDAQGNCIPSGIYLCRITTGNSVTTKKLIITNK